MPASRECVRRENERALSLSLARVIPPTRCTRVTRTPSAGWWMLSVCVRACVFVRMHAIRVYTYVRSRYIMYESVLVGKRPPLARRGLT